MNSHKNFGKIPFPETGIQYIRPEAEPAVFKAKWVIKDPWTILENAGIAVAEGRITSVLDTVPSDPSVTDCGPGILMPPLVNAHVHLELSALANRLPLGKGCEPWVKALLKERDSIGIPALIRSAQKSVQSFSALGTGLVGEVSTLGITRSVLSDPCVAGIWFQEYLGAIHPDLTLAADLPLSVSAAAHAPHTTSPDLMIFLKYHTQKRGLVFSIHVAESDAERLFIAGNNRPWHNFLIQRGIDPRDWPVGNKTPVAYLHELKILGPRTLAVHLLQVTDTDLDLLADTKTCICLCPRSNQNLHGRIPDIPAMLKRHLAPALGTDSLASCGSLSLFDEMRFVRQQYPFVLPADILAMATKNGAMALGMEKQYGNLAPGRHSEFIYLDAGATSRDQVLEKVTLYGMD